MTHQDVGMGHVDTIEEVVLDQEAVAEQVLKVSRERNAVILAHNYELPEVQDVADIVGDSLGLAREAVQTEAETIVFCGVHFMAETAYILNPERLVLLPEPGAGCPLADFATAEAVLARKQEYPDAAVVSYVNTSAEVKAVSDYCCTSSNAIRVVRAIDEDTVLFVPDRNLADYVARNVDKTVIPWQGYCYVHDQITPGQIDEALSRHPGAEVIAHPECRREVLDMAQHVESTSGMIAAARDSTARQFIVATECGMIYPLEKALPEKSFYSIEEEPVCKDMKKTTLSKVLWALQTLEPKVVVPEEVRIRALGAVERMLAL